MLKFKFACMAEVWAVGTENVPASKRKMSELTAPLQQLLDSSRLWDCPLTDVRFARAMDDNDPLRGFRQQFHYPKLRELPNSLGRPIHFSASRHGSRHNDWHWHLISYGIKNYLVIIE